MSRGRGGAPPLRAGERIAALAALCLLGFTFLRWYGAEPAGEASFSSGAGGSAWQTLGVVLAVLLVTIAVALAPAALRLARAAWRPAVPLDAWIAVLGGLSALLVLLRMVFSPDLGSVGGIALEATLSPGCFAALIAACGVAYGGYRALGEAGDSFAAIAARLSRGTRENQGKDAGRSPRRAHRGA